MICINNILWTWISFCAARLLLSCLLLQRDHHLMPNPPTVIRQSIISGHPVYPSHLVQHGVQPSYMFVPTSHMTFSQQGFAPHPHTQTRTKGGLQGSDKVCCDVTVEYFHPPSQPPHHPHNLPTIHTTSPPSTQPCSLCSILLCIDVMCVL